MAQQPYRYLFVGAEGQPTLGTRLALLGPPPAVEPGDLDPVWHGFDGHVIGCIRTPVPQSWVIEPSGVAVITDGGIELGGRRRIVLP